jgi:predicted nucleic acid-binding protein
MNEFIENFDVVYETNGIMTTLNSLIIKYKQDKQKIYDTNIVATMINNNIQKLFTFNTKNFKKITEIELINLD